jgi:tRNA(Ile)-lysidine synthase
MKKLRPREFRSLFFKHTWDFLKNVATSSELGGPHAIAVSGGLDSMTLLWFANLLHKEGKIGKIRAFFVNHGTREGQINEGELVKRFCEQEGIPFVLLEAEGLSSSDSNFEARARKERKSLFLKNLQKNELLWMGHHLDDSFEWNFMQRHRSSNPISMIGIPVRNKKIVRPFLCVSRAQIKRLSILEAIPFLEDPSNCDLRFDRNFVRHKIVPLIKERYPKYLKFYADFANSSAQKLGMSLLISGEASKPFFFKDGALLFGKKFSEAEIQALIHRYSNTNRGEILTTIQKMLKAIGNGKKGPFHFSGGVEAAYSHDLLMIYRQGMKNYDEAISRTLSKMSKNALLSMPTFNKKELESAWQNLLQSPDALMNLPGLVLVMESDSICKTLNTSVFDPLFPMVSEVCRAKGVRFITLSKCLDVWMQKKERLPESLRIVPLFSLASGRQI